VLLDGPLPFQHDAGVCRFYKFFDSSGHEGRMEKWNRLVVAAPHLSPEMPPGKLGEGNLGLLVPRDPAKLRRQRQDAPRSVAFGNELVARR
jgi:hypothetical protein